MLDAKFRDMTYSAVILMNSNVFSLPFSRYFLFHVALLICKFSDILNMILSNGKYVQKKKKDRLNDRGENELVFVC